MLRFAAHVWMALPTYPVGVVGIRLRNSVAEVRAKRVKNMSLYPMGWFGRDLFGNGGKTRGEENSHFVQSSLACRLLVAAVMSDDDPQYGRWADLPAEFCQPVVGHP